MIHPSAIVDDDVELGEYVTIRQFASVTRKSRVGDRCSIAPCAVVDMAVLEENVGVGHACSVNPGTYLRANVFLGPHVVFCNDNWPKRSKAGWSMEDFYDKPCIYVSYSTSIGANSTILPGVRIGHNCMIAAGSVVTRDIPNNHLWVKGEIIKIESDRERIKYAADHHCSMGLKR